MRGLIWGHGKESQRRPDLLCLDFQEFHSCLDRCKQIIARLIIVHCDVRLPERYVTGDMTWMDNSACTDYLVPSNSFIQCRNL